MSLASRNLACLPSQPQELPCSLPLVSQPGTNWDHELLRVESGSFLLVCHPSASRALAAGALNHGFPVLTLMDQHLRPSEQVVEGE